MTAEVIDDGPAAWTPTTRFAHSATCLPCTATGQQVSLWAVLVVMIAAVLESAQVRGWHLCHLLTDGLSCADCSI